MNVFFTIVANVLAAIYGFTNNYALAIIGLTLLIMLIVTPLTLKGTRSMMVMQQLQPEMKKIQTRYKDDRQKQNEELLKFYKENDISPLGGCLPLLVQAPVFIVLYQVLRGLTRRASDMGFDVGWVTGQLGTGTSTTKPPSIDRVFDPAFLNHSTKMYQNLSSTNTMQAFGMDLAESANKAVQQGLVHAIPYLMLIAIVAVTGFVQQRQIQGRNPNQQVNPQQQMIMKIMPVFLPVISFGLPAGLVLYFAVSNTFRVGQQWFISRSIYGIKRGDARPEPVTPAEPSKGFFASLKEAAGGANADAADRAKSSRAGGTSAKGSTTAKGASTKKSGAAPAKRASKASTSNGRSKDTAPAPAARTSKRVTPPKSGATKAKPDPSRATSEPASAEASGGSTPRRTPSSKGSDGATPGPAPTLQPRARKNKKG